MPETPSAAYRPMTAADIDATTYIRKAALDYLAQSEGRAPGEWRPARLPHFPHLLETDPDGAWVAEIDGTVVGYAMGFVRGDIWFLAQLFVMPDVHSSGLGTELLRRAVEAGRAKGARIISVISSTSPAAQTLYMRAGMFAVGIGYNVAGPVAALRAQPEPSGNRKIVVDCAGWQDRMAELDRFAWGAERRAEHALYLSDAFGLAARASFALNRDGELLGYGYAADMSGVGRIGPFAAYEPQDQLPLLRMAGDWLAEHDLDEATGYVVSHNQTVLGALLAGGWHINGWSFFLVSEPYGRFDRYVPSGGLLL